MAAVLSELEISIEDYLGLIGPKAKPDLRPFEAYETLVGLSQQILLELRKLNGSAPPVSNPKINQWSNIIVKISATNTPTVISKVPLPVRLAIVQNTNTSSTVPTTPINLSSQGGVKVGALLNPPTSSGLAGGSYPISSPSPGEFIDLSTVFITGADAGDQVNVGYV